MCEHVTCYMCNGTQMMHVRMVPAGMPALALGTLCSGSNEFPPSCCLAKPRMSRGAVCLLICILTIQSSFGGPEHQHNGQPTVLRACSSGLVLAFTGPSKFVLVTHTYRSPKSGRALRMHPCPISIRLSTFVSRPWPSLVEAARARACCLSRRYTPR